MVSSEFVIFRWAYGRQAHKVLLGAHRCEWIVVYGRLRLLPLEQVRILLFERTV